MAKYRDQLLAAADRYKSGTISQMQMLVAIDNVVDALVEARDECARRLKVCQGRKPNASTWVRKLAEKL